MQHDIMRTHIRKGVEEMRVIYVTIPALPHVCEVMIDGVLYINLAALAALQTSLKPQSPAK